MSQATGKTPATDKTRAASRRDLPAVSHVLEHPRLAALAGRVGAAHLTQVVRARIEAHRRAIAEDAAHPVPGAGAVADEVAAEAERWLEPKLTPVINLTGILLHTNLGRAPLSAAAMAAVQAAAGTVNLEYDLGVGQRGDRDALVEELICRLTGAEAATVVNNNAAAVYLVLNTLANRRPVAISRGELVEIGGSFRMPDIVRKSGCKLIEVGTTNRTHRADYAQALDDGARLLLKVHASNYRIEGFVKEVSLSALVELGREHGVPVVTDLGSGALVDMERWNLPAEPTVQEAVADGADVITFSGDKLLGGPQAGLVVGRREAVQRIKRNPMKRALRCDKLRLAALEATLGAFLSPETVEATLPAYAMIARPLAEIEDLAARLRPAFEGWAAGQAEVAVVAGETQAGSGSLPGATLPTRLLALEPRRGGSRRGGSRRNGSRQGGVKALARRLRQLSPPVIGRISGGRVLLDLRCLLDAGPLLAALEGGGGAP